MTPTPKRGPDHDLMVNAIQRVEQSARHWRAVLAGQEVTRMYSDRYVKDVRSYLKRDEATLALLRRLSDLPIDGEELAP